MAMVIKGFVCKERWTDEKSRVHEKRHGRIYHARAACDQLADLIRAQPAADGQRNRYVTCDEVRGEDGVG